MLDPGAGKTAKAYVWAYARGEYDATPGVSYDFCIGRGSKYPADFLAEWAGTLTCDDYAGYDVVFRREGCIEAGCLAHARRKTVGFSPCANTQFRRNKLAKLSALRTLSHSANTHDLPTRPRNERPIRLP